MTTKHTQSHQRRILALLLAALGTSIAAATIGCTMPEEGEPGDIDHARAPRPDGVHVDAQADDDGGGESSSDSDSDSEGAAGVSGEGETGGDDSSAGLEDDASTDDSAAESSSGNAPAVPEPHCDASCPEADRIHSDDAGTACVCAPLCESDADCTGETQCGSTGVAGIQRCYIECDAPSQCPLDGSAPMWCRYYQGSISVCMWDGES